MTDRGSNGVRLGARLVLFAPLAAGCESGPAPAPAGSDPRIARVLEGLRPAVAIEGAPAVRWTLAERMNEAHVPGLSIAVIDGGRIVWARGFGVQEAGSSDSVTPETLFQAQSISKAVAVSAMLRLVEQGQLGLDQDVNEYLRSWRVPENRFTEREKVTLRRIASHSAGLTVGGMPGYRLGDSLPTTVQILNGTDPANTPPIQVDTTPGAIWRYSGGGMTVMQQVMIDVTGKPFPELMRELLLDPLDLARSTYEQPLPESRRSEAASGHDAEGRIIDRKWPIQPEMATAGLWTTATELARWAIEVAEAWAGRSDRLWSKQMAAEMLTPQKDDWGLGVSLRGSGDELRFGHGGANSGFRAELVMFPKVGKGAVILTNADGGSQLTGELLQSIAAEHEWPGFGQVERTTVPVDPAQLDSLTGEYQVGGDAASRNIVVQVSREGGGLALEVPNIVPRMHLYPASADSFFTIAGADVVFTRDATGRGVKVRLGGQDEATRAPAGPERR